MACTGGPPLLEGGVGGFASAPPGALRLLGASEFWEASELLANGPEAGGVNPPVGGVPVGGVGVLIGQADLRVTAHPPFCGTRLQTMNWAAVPPLPSGS